MSKKPMCEMMPVRIPSRTEVARSLAIAILTVCFSVTSKADNWPQFRGPHANAISTRPLPKTWSDHDGETENIRWKIPVAGEGWSQPVVWDERVFLTAAVPMTETSSGPEPYSSGGGRAVKELMKTEFLYQVVCMDANSGDELWRTTCKEEQPPIPRHSTNTYATETPITDGERVYAYFGMNGIYALDLQGNVQWQKDLGVFEMRADWGTASSPTLFEGKLFVQVDNQIESFLIALDAETGDEVWRVSRNEKSQYSSPMIWRNSLRNELIVGGMVYRSHDPATGKLLWELDMAKGRSSATPVADGDRLFVGNELRNRGGDDDGGGRLFCVKPGGSGDITPPDDSQETEFVAWWIEKADMQMASPTICNGKIYLFERSTGNMHCVNMDTGETVYRQRVRGAKAFWASPWTDGRQVFSLDASGTTHVLSSSEKYELLAANELDQQAWSTPALADGRIYLRTIDHLYCIENQSPVDQSAK
ncbi:outer membrane protein assembly factor BamB family protein [Rubripirellula reticaptiva]|uniref:Outer membrane biogenesis protein BamB n=1 Tax=Rubripirellula reticaptiva TaxID=2528013 RepID=A0A5C6EBA6_9BACT|nr:PQQ-binding-like beta-propeller repeat protein [Rubripirellula reticaptiva]TWU47033.1 outer membrane biogenesis protein BamB [Rubripirellula reticaptiva]